MATVRENLVAAKQSYSDRLAEMALNPMMTHTVDGRQYSATEYQAFLIKSMNDLDIAIQSEDGPTEVLIQGMT